MLFSFNPSTSCVLREATVLAVLSLCGRDGKLCYDGRLEYDLFAFYCALLPALSTIFLLFFALCFLRGTLFSSHFLLPYPGMFTG